MVDKLLTGFDAPSATYLYIDKSMRDHDLFQAICRVNRPDGEDKDYGYIVDYMDLFRNLQLAVSDYTTEAFDGFDINTVARYDDQKTEELMQNPEVIRSRAKIKAAVHNAKAVQEIVCSGEFRSFDDYVWHFTGGKQIVHHLKHLSEMPAQDELSETVSTDMKKRGFNFVGPVICYSFLQGVGR